MRKSFSIAISVMSLWSATAVVGQQPKSATKPELPPEKRIALAEQGHCPENISALKHALVGNIPAADRKRAGVVGVRCALAVDNRDATLEFIRLLHRQFAKDPDVLFVVVHAYSDLSTRAAQDLAQSAPQSIAALLTSPEARKVIAQDFDQAMNSLLAEELGRQLHRWSGTPYARRGRTCRPVRSRNF